MLSDGVYWKKITPGHCQSVNAQIPSSVSFVRNLRAYVMKGFGAHSDTPTIGIMGEVGCSVSLRDGFHLGRVQVFWISHLIAHFAVFPEISRSS
jgi:hypothetical protein